MRFAMLLPLLKQVYAELDGNPEMKSFYSVQTCLDMSEVVRRRYDGRLFYRRIPMIDDAVPREKVINK